MELENEKRASILSDALPYIQQYSNKVVVVKYGGNAMTNDRLKQAECLTLFCCRSAVSR